ncbi:MAG TPA: hypothetical protein VF859_01395 [Burkholderiales bacterium]
MDGHFLTRLATDLRLARRIGFGWGFAEGLVFFIVPDVFISFATLFSLRAGVAAWIASIAGSLVAVVVLYALILKVGLDYLGFLDILPGISTQLVAAVSQEVGAQGLPYTPLFMLSGVPLKVWAGSAIANGVPLGAVLLWTIFARLVRIAPTVLGFSLARRLWPKRPEDHPVGWTAAAGAFWLVFYAFYFVRMSG